VAKKKRKLNSLSKEPKRSAVGNGKRPQLKVRSKNMTAEEKKRSELSMEETRTSAVEEKPQLSTGDLSGGNLDKVREILFGTQMRNLEKRLIRLEERLTKDTAELKDEMRRRFDTLEGYVKREVESLGDRIKAEERERTDSLKDLSREVKDSNKEFEKRLVHLDDNATKSQRELSQQILDRSKSLTDELHQKYEDLNSLLEREALELRTDKADRAALATLFTEMAMRLNNDFKIPLGE
jgi:hypothetical protein